ncbi:MAG: DUF47 domain-containing protein [bacterium]|jgi:predicted phosphate transport protein (TIGR00153 family)
MQVLSLFRKQRSVEELIQRLLRSLEDLALHYREAVAEYLDGALEPCEQRAREVDRLESELDELQRRIQYLLLREALMPDSRDDVLRLLTKLDRIPGQCRHSLKELLLERPPLPADFRTPLLNLLQKTHASIQALSATVDALFSDLRSVRRHVEEVSRQESEADRVEQELLQRVFRDDALELARQFQYKALLQRIGGISDLAEDVADEVLLLATKRLA